MSGIANDAIAYQDTFRPLVKPSPVTDIPHLATLMLIHHLLPITPVLLADRLDVLDLAAGCIALARAGLANGIGIDAGLTLQLLYAPSHLAGLRHGSVPLI